MSGKKAKTKRRSIVGALVLGVLLLIMGFELVHVYRQVAAARAEEATISARLEQRQQENEDLQSDLSHAQDPEFYKQLARSQLNLTEQGERIFYDVNH